MGTFWSNSLAIFGGPGRHSVGMGSPENASDAKRNHLTTTTRHALTEYQISVKSHAIIELAASNPLECQILYFHCI